MNMLGEGIIKGLAETARNFIGSYVDEDRLTTVQYPEERLPAQEAARNFPFLVFDGNEAHAGLRCVPVEDEEWKIPRGFLGGQTFFRVLDGGQPVFIDITA